jgi:hypothetical protein
VGYKNYNYIVTHPNIDPNNPDFTPGDSNPYGVSAGRHGAYVVDAGSNTLDRVGYNGNINVRFDRD